MSSKKEMTHTETDALLARILELCDGIRKQRAAQDDGNALAWAVERLHRHIVEGGRPPEPWLAEGTLMHSSCEAALEALAEMAKSLPPKT